MKILFISTILLLVGCGVTPENWYKAENVCKNNGGVKMYLSSRKFVRCANGAGFDI